MGYHAFNVCGRVVERRSTNPEASTLAFSPLDLLFCAAVALGGEERKLGSVYYAPRVCQELADQTGYRRRARRTAATLAVLNCVTESSSGLIARILIWAQWDE